MKSTRFRMSGIRAALAVLLLLSAAMTQAQEPEPPPPPPADPKAEQPAADAKSADREFRPSEQVSPDQEVDFPSDL